MRLTPNSRSTYHLKRYFATGQITRQAASQIYRDYSRVVQRMLTPAAAAIWISIYAILLVPFFTILLIPIIRSILKIAKDIMMPDLLPGGVEARKHLIRRLDKGSNRLKKGMRNSTKTKKELDQVNKMIKQVEDEAKSSESLTWIFNRKDKPKRQ